MTNSRLAQVANCYLLMLGSGLYCQGLVAEPTSIGIAAEAAYQMTTSDTATEDEWLVGGVVDDPNVYHGNAQTYQRTIEETENRYGVYDRSLTHQLMGLGVAQQSQGGHEAAVESFERAIHISRINDGLHNLGQVPMINRLIQSYTATKNYNSVSRKHYYLYQLLRRGYGDNDKRLLEPLANIIKWHMQAYTRNAGQEPILHLLKARAFNRRMINIIEVNFGASDMRLGEALYRQALTSYQLAIFQSENPPVSEGSGISGRSGKDLSSPSGDGYGTVYSLNPYSDGKKALVRRVEVFEKNADSDAKTKANALLHLGDWYFVFNKKASALKVYQRAHEIFVSDELTRKDVERVFGKPHALAFELPVAKDKKEKAKKKQDNEAEGELKKGYVEAVFNVTAAGRARNIQIVQSEPPNLMDSIVQRSIKATRYRPRFVNGQLVNTENVTYRHDFDL